MLLDRARSALLIIDVQERLVAAMAEPAAAVQNCLTLMKAALRLGVPMTISQQYPKGLGQTLPEVKVLAPPDAVFDKVHFSCVDDPQIGARIEDLGRDQIVVTGVETHVCVLQTALGLAERGFGVFVVGDAVASRRPADRDAAFRRLEQNHVPVVTTEMVVFEWLGQAGTPEFKELQALVR